MKEKARVLLWNKTDDSVLLLKREKEGKTYYVVPGGSVEAGESIKQAAVREIREEVSFETDVEQLVLFCSHTEDGVMERFFYIPLEEAFEPVIGGEEAKKNCAANRYTPEWHCISELAELPLKPSFISFEIGKHCTTKRKRLEVVELTNMCLVEDGDRILLQNRHKDSWSGYAMPGGHVEPGESIVASVKREIYEETGLAIEDPRLVGVKQFPIEEGRYIVFLFKATRFTGSLKNSEEGNVGWFSRNEVKDLKTVSGFEENLRVFDDDAISEMRYVDDENGSSRLLFNS